MNTDSLKDISKSNPIQNEEKEEEKVVKEDIKKEQPKKEVESSESAQTKATESSKTKEEPKEKVHKKKPEEAKDVNLKRRDTDNDFEVEEVHHKTSKKDSDTLENKADVKLKEDKYQYTSKKPIIKPRHSVRGSRGNRRPYQNRFAALIEQHLDNDEASSPEKSNEKKEEVKEKVTLIGDRKETEKFGKQAEDNDWNTNNLGRGRSMRGGFNNRSEYSGRGGYKSRGGFSRGAQRGGRYRQK